MRVSYVMLAVVLLGCGGGGGDGYPTGNGGGSGNGSGSGAGGGSGASGSATVSMTQSDDGYGAAVFSFSPTAVTISRGGTVTWSNEEGKATHNVTFSPAAGVPANVQNLASGTASRTFSTAGSFSYQCTNHSGMTGLVTVQ